MSPFKPNPLEAESAVTYTNVDVPFTDTPFFKLDEDEVVCCFYYPMLEWLYENHAAYAENADVHFGLLESLPDCMGNICSEITTTRMYTVAVHSLMRGARLFIDEIMQRPRQDFTRDVGEVLARLACLAEQLDQPRQHLTADVLEMVGEIGRCTLEMEPLVAATAYYVGYSYMDRLNRHYWDYPNTGRLSDDVAKWFQDVCSGAVKLR